MTQQDYINEFYKFLRENNAEEQFKKDKLFSFSLEYTRLWDFIVASVGWRKSRKSEFWLDLDAKWQTRLKELQSPERFPDAGKTISEEPRIAEVLHYIEEYKKGTTLQYKCWTNGIERMQSIPTFDELFKVLYDKRVIRVKPKTLRAYTLDELLEIPYQSKLREKYDAENVWEFHGVFRNDKGIKISLINSAMSGHARVCYEDTMFHKFQYTDGRPFGVEE